MAHAIPAVHISWNLKNEDERVHSEDHVSLHSKVIGPSSSIFNSSPNHHKLLLSFLINFPQIFVSAPPDFFGVWSSKTSETSLSEKYFPTSGNLTWFLSYTFSNSKTHLLFWIGFVFPELGWFLGTMAMHVSSACFSALSERRVPRVRAVASENVTTEDDKVKLGGSDLKVTRLGIGAWSWGDTSYWNNFQWDDRKMKAAKAAFDVSVDGGITFFDTAEVYGSRASFGAVNSETLLGRFIKERKQKDPGVEVAVATKFAALPWRLGRQSVIAALKDSLNRLELSSVELYQLHWPGIWGNEGYLDGLGDAVEQGLVKAVGVSNYSEKRLRKAHAKLQERGIPLASNQVNYSLIYRAPEENGVKSTCDELGITLIAYSPIAQGALTGKYTPENPPTGPRRQIYTPEFLSKLQPLLNRIKEIGEKYSKTYTQVVLNWLIAQGNVVPIPGAKNAEQAAEFAGALGWRLNSEEVAELSALATEIKPVTGFPVEKL